MPFFKLRGMLPCLAICFLCLRAEGGQPPMDPRVKDLFVERSQEPALPLPTNVSFADVIGADIEVFDNDNDTHKEGTHAFFINLSRGNLVDEAALAAALREKHIAGAAMDVGRASALPPGRTVARSACWRSRAAGTTACFWGRLRMST